jgi:hypothetical protein
VIPDLIHKLTRALKKPVQTECEVVYVMVEIRKLMDRGEGERRKTVPEADRRRLRPEFPVLKLFCDWAVHINIEWNREAEPLMREFDGAVESVKAGNGIPLAFLEFLSLSHLREEFARFLKVNGLPIRLVEDAHSWDRFLDLYSAVVSDCPITYTNRQIPFKLISTLTLTKDTPKEESYAFVRSLLGREPHSVWMNWRIELTDGTVENWPFYN